MIPKRRSSTRIFHLSTMWGPVQCGLSKALQRGHLPPLEPCENFRTGGFLDKSLEKRLVFNHFQETKPSLLQADDADDADDADVGTIYTLSPPCSVQPAIGRNPVAFGPAAQLCHLGMTPDDPWESTNHGEVAIWGCTMMYPLSACEPWSHPRSGMIRDDQGTSMLLFGFFDTSILNKQLDVKAPSNLGDYPTREVTTTLRRRLTWILRSRFPAGMVVEV